MILCRLILPEWKHQENTKIPKVLEGMFDDNQIYNYNINGYNIYYLPNAPRSYTPDTIVDGAHIDAFNYVFVDCDIKDGIHTKETFLDALCMINLPTSLIVDSGHGIHAYWKVSNLDAMSYLRFQRRLCRFLNTDEAVSKLMQLMRLPGTINTKIKDNQVVCQTLEETNLEYTCEELDKLLPPITKADEDYCIAHYNKTYKIDQPTNISEVLPPKFGKLLKENTEAKAIWAEPSDDRSSGDYRLGHLMFANGFTKDEALSVLAQTAKALQRAPIHRISYANNIVEKIWTYEQAEDKETVTCSPTVRDILSKGEDVVKGTRFPCNKLIDDTKHGFRLGQVIGIIGGSGVGKTTLTLNMFLWFCSNNPDYHHFFFSLEQPAGEIASRIRTICGNDDSMYDKIHIVSNYNEDGTYNNFSMSTIEDHILNFQKNTTFKVGTAVVDHIGVLAKETRNGENDGLIGVCREMKAVAVRTNIMLLMLSQAPREKSGVGDLELDKSAAYGTVFFESFVDYCLCLWQPLKRAYSQGAPTIMALKFCKIRHKHQNHDNIKEDVCYQLFFDPNTERLREVTQTEEESVHHYNSIATNLRKLDRKTDIIPYTSRRVDNGA